MKAWAVLLAIVLVGGVAFPARAQQPGTVRINYVDADLRDVIRSLAAVVGVNVVLTDVPSKRITLQTPEPIPAAQAGAVLEAVLESQGLVLVETGPVAQVLPEAKRPSTGPVRMGKELPTPPPLGIITQIVPLEFIRADEAVSLLTQTAGKGARIEVVPRSNAVLITDRGASVARYLDLLRQLDVKTGGESGLRTYVYPLKHASAVELASTLGQVFGTGGGGGAPPERARVQALENRSLSSDLEAFRRREIQALEQRRQNPIPTLAPPPAAATPQPAAESLGGAAGAGLVGQTTIVPDQATNSLVIRTAPPNFPVLQETIDQLDVRPAQVLLEVLIAEVELDRATQYGINWQLFTQELVSGDSTRGITAGFGAQVFSDSALSGAGFGLRVVSMANVSVRAIVKALSSRVRVRVLSTPRILALNNEEARILVGSEVPFNQSTRTGLDVIVDQTVQFRKVGTQLTIIPTVNKDGYVTFRVLQEASALTAQTIPSALNAPVITTREAETSAIVKDGNTVIIGGLISETHTVTQSGVPILEDLPLLGGLFRTKGNSRQRNELAIFLTPHVVLNDQQADSLLKGQRDKFRGAKEAIDSILAPPVQRKR
jgi:general secretion pathway protein D